MHGRQRSQYKAMQRDPAVAASLAAKAEKWNALSREIANRRQTRDSATMDTDETSLALTEKMLLVNPDPMYLWNFRRELLVVEDTQVRVDTDTDTAEVDTAPRCRSTLLYSGL
jgi:geranylgeranyl transferase type-2 subunit alpha